METLVEHLISCRTSDPPVEPSIRSQTHAHKSSSSAGRQGRSSAKIPKSARMGRAPRSRSARHRWSLEDDEKFILKKQEDFPKYNFTYNSNKQNVLCTRGCKLQAPVQFWYVTTMRKLTGHKVHMSSKTQLSTCFPVSTSEHVLYMAYSAALCTQS